MKDHFRKRGKQEKTKMSVISLQLNEKLVSNFLTLFVILPDLQDYYKYISQ